MITAQVMSPTYPSKGQVHLTDEQLLVEACQAGEERAFRLLYDHYAPLLLTMARRYTTHSEESEDILQEAFIKIFRNIKRYKSNGSFEGWIKRILINTAINHFHAQARIREQTSLDSAAVFQSEDADAIQRLSAEELISKVRQLPDGYRMVFNLYVIEGFDHQEIAKMMKISVGTSRSQLAKAKRKLQDMIRGPQYNGS